MTIHSSATVTPEMAPLTEVATFRAAQEEDLPALLDLYRQLIPDANPTLPAMQDALEYINSLNDGGMVVVAELEGRIVATCQVVVYHNLVRAPKVKAEIDSVVVEEAYRGRGLGKAMMRWAMMELERRGCAKIIVATSYSREVAHRLYSSMGFEEFGYSFVYTSPCAKQSG